MNWLKDVNGRLVEVSRERKLEDSVKKMEERVENKINEINVNKETDRMEIQVGDRDGNEMIMSKVD